MLNYLLAVLRDEDGASLVEYALIVALVSVVAITALTHLGSSANVQLQAAATSMA